jgi:hypothetical protein
MKSILVRALAGFSRRVDVSVADAAMAVAVPHRDLSRAPSVKVY